MCRELVDCDSFDGGNMEGITETLSLMKRVLHNICTFTVAAALSHLKTKHYSAG